MLTRKVSSGSVSIETCGGSASFILFFSSSTSNYWFQFSGIQFPKISLSLENKRRSIKKQEKNSYFILQSNHSSLLAQVSFLGAAQAADALPRAQLPTRLESTLSTTILSFFQPE